MKSENYVSILQVPTQRHFWLLFLRQKKVTRIGMRKRKVEDKTMFILKD